MGSSLAGPIAPTRAPDTATPLGTVGSTLESYSNGDRSVLSVVEEFLDRVTARGDDHVWISRTAASDLTRAARGLDAVARDASGRRPGLPLFGVLVAVKDNIDVAGLPTTAACPEYAYRPPADAAAVGRLRAAGALVVGKTNLDQFATGLVGTRSPYGTPANVLDARLVPGGSSSGSAVAVAADLVPVALGTDTAGSGRVPAALNGIVGLKPTRGTVSTAGVVPACRSLDCVSVFTRDVAGAAAVLDVVAGPESGDPWSRTGTAVAAPHLAALRLGLPDPDALEFFGDTAMAAAHARARDDLCRLVGHVSPVDLAPFLEASALLYGPWLAERWADLGDFVEAHPNSIHPVTLRVLSAGYGHSATALFTARHRLQELRHAARRVFTAVDVLAVPSVGTTPSLADVAAEPFHHNTRLGTYTNFVNLLDLSAVAVPAGTTSDGRPAGVTLIGPAFAEPTLLALASAMTGGAAPERPRGATTDGRTLLAVVGRHLAGEDRNHQLVERGGVLVETTTTDPGYRLYVLGGPGGDLPALVRRAGGGHVEVELWSLPTDRIGDLLALVPAPLGFGGVHLADGRRVLGFLAEAAAVDAGLAAGAATDITARGGWRNRPRTPQEGL